MRARCLLLLLAMAVAAAGCAVRPVATMPVAADPPARSIDSMAYGSMARATPSAATVAPVAGRGLFSASAPPIFDTTTSPTSVRTAVSSPPIGQQPYTLDTGDRLRVVVFGQNGLSNSYLVDASGYIDMPLIGMVRARGLTINGLGDRIADKLRQGFVRDPQVAVEVEAYRPFFILGEVAQPGLYPYIVNMTVETAVAIAGGFSPRAYQKTVTVNRVVHGLPERLTVPLSYLLRPGDTVNVHERWF